MTFHASERLAARSCLDAASLVDLLDRGLARRVSVSKARSHLAHRLYWSPRDQDYFVAVQDIVTGNVVTILTARMFDTKYPGILTAKQYDKVVNKSVLAGLACRSHWRATVPTRGYVSARLLCDTHVVERTLGRWQAALPAPHVAAVGAMDKFWKWVGARISALGLPLDSVETVRLRLPYGDGAPVPYLR